MATRDELDTVRPVLQQRPRNQNSGPFSNAQVSVGQDSQVTANSAANARPRFEQVLRNPHMAPGAPAPNLNHKNHGGDWAVSLKKYREFVKAWEQTAAAGKEYYRLIYKTLIPAAEALFTATPELDCNFEDSELAPHNLRFRMTDWEQTFDPSAALANSMGSVESRKFNDHSEWLKKLPSWLYRLKPKTPGISELE